MSAQDEQSAPVTDLSSVQEDGAEQIGPSASAEPAEPGAGPGTAEDGADDGEQAATVGAAPAAEDTEEQSTLEDEGEVAADYLEELLDVMDLDGDIDIDVEDERAVVSVVADGDDTDVPSSSSSLSRLVGRRGEVLEALQELTRLAVQTRTGDRSRLVLDVAGYRGERRQELEAAASVAVEGVRASGESVRLEPMNPFERKVVHDVVAGAGLVSDSEGVEPQRCVVVHPA